MKKVLFKTSISEIRGILLVCIGVITIAFYFSWWLVENRWQNPFLFLGLLFAVTYCIMQIFGTWLLYLATHRREEHVVNAHGEMSVDVFVTSCGEELSLIEKSLSAACSMKGNHTTWLLDDSADSNLESLALNLGAKYLTRASQEDAKAGNVNAAIQRTSGQIIVIFDIDHVPHRDFLERTIKHFADPKVGFVQVMPTFLNANENWVAGAAAETSLDFYNPTSKGMDGFRSVTKMGTNSLIRRSALESIGGYKPGLAEDLATSLELHGNGWHSIYVAEPLAPGLAPSDLEAWFIQQLKWSRGVFELFITSFPRLFLKFNVGQKISYSVRTTKYLIGITVALHLFLTIFGLTVGSQDWTDSFENYLVHLFPLLFADAAIRSLALRKWKSSSVQSQPQRRAVSLVYSTWPVYLLALIMAIFRIKLNFKPTPKESGYVHFYWLIPQTITVILMTSGITLTILRYQNHFPWFLFLFALIQLSAHFSFFSQVLISIFHRKTELEQETTQTLNAQI